LYDDLVPRFPINDAVEVTAMEIARDR
jgi:hypothetical protein